MDWLEELGTIAIGSRLRRLGDIFVEQVATIYREHGIELNPRFFPLISLLAEKNSLGVTEVAEALKITHAAVSQMSQTLEKDGWIKSSISEFDERKRIISLTTSGYKRVEQLKPLWHQIRSAVNSLLVETDTNLLHSVALTEKALLKKSLQSRINDESFSLKGLTISKWNPAYKQSFYDLNAEWIEQYFSIEDADLKSLKNPEKYYLERDGEIFFAKLGATIVGTCAVVETAPKSFELSKMAVSSLAQGRGVGKALLQDVIAYCKKKGAIEVWLETASVLKTAISMYQKLGFKIEPHPRGGSHYKRADIFMRLVLKDTET